MHGGSESRDKPDPFSFAGELAGVETVDAAVAAAVEATTASFDQPVITVCSLDPDENAVTCVDRSTTAAETSVPPPPAGLVARVQKNGGTLRVGETGEAAPTTGLRGPLREEIVAPVGSFGALSVGSTATGAFDEDDATVAEGIASALGSALTRIEGDGDTGETAVGTEFASGDADDADVAALGRLNELTTDASGVDATIEAMLSLGCDHLGLEAGILSHVEGADYHIESVVDTTGRYEEGATFALKETMCAATLATPATEPLSFSDVRDTEHAEHPAAGGVRAYVGVPVVVDGERYGTVNFSSRTARENAFRPAERAFVTSVAGWIGNAIERRRRFAELERYETILEAVDDPVYALDTDGRFTFVNAAAKREFGYGEEILGEHVSIGMREADINRITDARRALSETGERSVRSQFTLETADGEERTVENRLAVIGDEEFRGTAGVLRDVTERERHYRRLESFQQAIGEAADGVAILEDGEYVFVDQTHRDMYGFERREQLLGNTWRMLYDDDEVARLEAEAFPELESTGHWRGKVTGSRPDGTTFPAELSLTIVGDGRLVCTVRDETERAARERDLELKERAMDEANVGIRITDPTQEGDPMVYVNDGFEAMTGHDEADALGENPRMLHSPDADPETVGRLREAIAGEIATTVDVRHVRADGTPYWARVSVTPVHDDSGDLTNIIGIQQDITERKTRERKREATVEVFERAYQVTTDPDRSFQEKVDGLLAAGQEYLDLPNGFLTRIEPDTGEGTQTIVDSRGSHEHLQQGESCPLPQSYCRKTIGRDDLTTITNATETGWKGDPAHDLFGLETYIGGEVTAGGDLYGTLCFASTEPRNTGFTETERSFVSLLRRWAGYEIERENDRVELTEQRERLELVLSGTETGIAEWDLRADTVLWNETLREIVGRDPDTVEAFIEAVHPDDRDRVRDRLETMIETGDFWSGEFRMIGGDDEVLWLETRAVPVYEDGDPVRVLATGTDVTDTKRTEHELFEERERFRLLTRSVEEYAFITLDAEGDVATWNEGAERLFGYDHERAVGTAIGQFHPTAERESGLPDRLLQQARIAGESAHEGRHIRADGSEFYADVRYAKLRSDDEEVPGYAMIVKDMTERRQQRRRTERFVEESDDVVSILDTDGTITYASGSADRVLGYDSEDLVGESLFDHIHPDDREVVMETFFGGIQERTERAEIECRIESGDGEWLRVDARLRNELDDNAIDGMLLYLRDVTESKQQARRFESIFNQTFQFTGLLEPDGTVIEANDSALEFGEFDREDVIGEPFHDVPWWTHSETVREDVRDALDRAASGEFIRYETEVQGANGIGTIDFSVKPVTDEYGEITLLIVEGRDITAQQERRRQMGMMQRVMRHNMRNDLSEMRGYAGLLHEATDPDRRAEYLGVINGVLDKWEGMTEKMRVIRKLLRTQPTRGSGRDATDLLEDAITEARNDLPEVSIETDVAVDDSVTVSVELREAVRELILNAGQASDHPVEVRASESGENGIEVAVSDDGSGMPDVEAEVLKSGDVTALSHGEGLGLWLVRTVVDRVGGDVSVESSPEGTTVTLGVPGHRSVGGDDGFARSE